MARQKVRIEAHGLVELLTSYGGRAHRRRVGAGARQCPDGQRQSAAVAVRLRKRVEELRVRHSASVARAAAAVRRPSSSRAADELRPVQPCSGMDVSARGCRPTGCGSLIRGGALCEFRRRVWVAMNKE
jgi:hypothetical protein